MDAEKFDKVVLDLLYDELDELTRASAIRHMEQSGRAKALYSELRATREVGSVPLVEPPAGLEERILEAEARARAGRPLHQRIGTMVSIIASYAMRPQVGMAAVLLLMVGSSLLLLRVKPGEPSSVQVTERGVPESDKEVVAVVPAPPGGDMPTRGEEQAAARTASHGRATDAVRPSDAPQEKPAEREEPRRSAPARNLDLDSRLAAKGQPTLDGLGSGAPGSAADPYAEGASAGATLGGSDKKAKDDESAAAPAAVRDECEITLPRYEAALARAASAIEANRARWGAAECYARLGRIESARKTYTALLGARAYADRARSALNALPPEPPATAAGPFAAAPPQAAPKAAAKPAAPSASAAPKPEGSAEP
ncbi:MAG TPA: hypothetical protein VF395_17925 [Polyangiaceae bacterium]